MKGASLPRGSTVDARQFASALRLTNKLHWMAEGPFERKRELVRGLLEIVHADLGGCAVLYDDGGPAPAVSAPVFVSKSERPSAAEGDAFNALLAQRWKPGAQAPKLITSRIHLARGNVVASLAVRRGPKAPPFSVGDRLVVNLFHAESKWVYDFDLPLASPAADPLSVPQRETLQYLLAGASEKDIAAWLRRSQNTVHHHIKELYRHFGVGSRAQLLARWIRTSEATHGPETGPRKRDVEA